LRAGERVRDWHQTKERDKRGESEKESSMKKKEPACDELKRPVLRRVFGNVCAVRAVTKT
jgi:hypothetical protein